MGHKRLSGSLQSNYDAPVAGAAGKRTVVRPSRLNSDDDLPSTRKRPATKRRRSVAPDGREPPKDSKDSWTATAARDFHRAYNLYKRNWRQVAKAVGCKTAQACEALYNEHSNFLNVDAGLRDEVVFVTMVCGQEEVDWEEFYGDGDDVVPHKKVCLPHKKGRRTPRNAVVPRTEDDKSDPLEADSEEDLAPWNALFQAIDNPLTSQVNLGTVRESVGTLPSAEELEICDSLLSLCPSKEDPGANGLQPHAVEGSAGGKEGPNEDPLSLLEVSVDRQESEKDAAQTKSAGVQECPGPQTPYTAAAPLRVSRRKGRGRHTSNRRRNLSAITPTNPIQTAMRLRPRKEAAVQGSDEAGHISQSRPFGARTDLRFEQSDDEAGDGETMSDGARMHTSEEPGSVTPERVMVRRVNRRKSAPERMQPGNPARSRSMGAAAKHLQTSSLGYNGMEDSTMKSTLQVKLENCLLPQPRRWIMYEFFYSAIDRPFFLDNKFLSGLRDIGIPPATRLTKIDLNFIRSALGGGRRPRRLSLAFLQEERARLELHRLNVRKVYKEKGAGKEIPPDLPRPLKVTQKVTARHPVTRQLQDGSILYAAHDTYRVQFDRRDLGTELVQDIDVMPMDPSENLPLSSLAEMPPTLVNGRLATSVPSRARAAGALGASPLSFSNYNSLDAAFLARDPLHGSDPNSHYHELIKKKKAAERLRDELNAQQDEHKYPDGRLKDDFQKRFSEVVLVIKQTQDSIQSLLMGASASATPSVWLNPHYGSAYQKRGQGLARTDKQPLVSDSPAIQWQDCHLEAARIVRNSRANNERSNKRLGSEDGSRVLSSENLSTTQQQMLSKEANSMHNLLVATTAKWVFLQKVAISHIAPQDASALYMKALPSMEATCPGNKDLCAQIQEVTHKIINAIASL
eukprot:jgi/Botrbrau1/14178/Bobra.182_3s0113.2